MPAPHGLGKRPPCPNLFQHPTVTETPFFIRHQHDPQKVKPTAGPKHRPAAPSEAMS